MTELCLDPAPLGTDASGLERQAPETRDGTRAADIVATFNTWSFKREQPNAAHLEACVRSCVQAQRPVTFALYWGKGPRDTLAAPDVACLDYLARMSARVAAVHRPGALFHLVLTDTHAALNGHAAWAFGRYFADIELEARRRGFATSRLSDLVDRLRPLETTDTAIDPKWLARLAQSAERWFRGHGDARDGAERYYRANMIERRAVEQAFPHAIFATFNGSDCDFLFPEQMPKFYMYALRKGFCIKPWFLDAAGRPIPGL